MCVEPAELLLLLLPPLRAFSIGKRNTVPAARHWSAPWNAQVKEPKEKGRGTKNRKRKKKKKKKSRAKETDKFSFFPIQSLRAIRDLKVRV